MLSSCARIERRDPTLTKDVQFDYAKVTTSCRELWVLHEKNKINNDAGNKRMKQIREGN